MSPTLAAIWPPVVVAAALTILGTRHVLAWLIKRQILDRPNERSSHKLPVPRGGGLAVTPAMLVGWMMVASTPGPMSGWAWVLVAGCLLLMVASWADDRHNLPAAPRFIAHAGVVAGALVMLPDGALVFQGALPPWADRVVTALGWLWFVNLYNFMDGIDGITGVETGSIGIGIAIVALVAGTATGIVPLALVCAAAGLAFLAFNWHPARIFLGDVGSIPLGFLLGGLLVQLAAGGQLAAALILPAYYLADATITLVRRALNGEKVWQAHRKHFYQRAVQGGKGHDRVALAVAGGNALLVACAVFAALGHTAPATLGAVAVVGGLLALLQSWSKA